MADESSGVPRDCYQVQCRDGQSQLFHPDILFRENHTETWILKMFVTGKEPKIYFLQKVNIMAVVFMVELTTLPQFVHY